MEKVAIIVLNCNASQYLEKCFSSIFGLDYPNFEVIMVDDGSLDNSVELVREKFPRVVIIGNDRNLGAPVSFNKAVALSQAPLLLKLDSDVIIEKDCLSKMVSTLESDQKIGVVGSMVLYYDSDEVQDIGSNVDRFGYQTNYYTMVGLPKDGSKIRDAFYVSGCSMLFRKNLYEKIGGFDDKYFLYKDDLDFCWRVRLLGYQVVSDLNSKIHHVSGVVVGGKTILDAEGRYHTTVRKRYFGERNTLRALLKNYSTLTLLKILLVYFLIIFAEVIFFAARGQFGVSKAYLRAVWWNVQNFPDTLIQRGGIQLSRKVADGVIMKDMICGSSKLNYFKTIRAPIFEAKLL